MLASGLHSSKDASNDRADRELGNRVSRKLEFVPPVMALLNEGWSPDVVVRAEDELAPEVETTHLPGCIDGACLVRTMSNPKDWRPKEQADVCAPTPHRPGSFLAFLFLSFAVRASSGPSVYGGRPPPQRSVP